MPDARARRLVGMIALLGSLLVVPAPPGVQAAENAPPEARDDLITLYAGGRSLINPLENDSDPDGDELEICRLGPASPGLRVERERAPADFGLAEGTLDLRAGARTGGRTLELVYYACDAGRLSPATVTIEVLRPIPMQVRTVPGRPGEFRVRNNQRFEIEFSYSYRRGNSIISEGWTLFRGDRQRFRTRTKGVRWTATNLLHGYADRGRLDLR